MELLLQVVRKLLSFQTALFEPKQKRKVEMITVQFHGKLRKQLEKSNEIQRRRRQQEWKKKRTQYGSHRFNFALLYHVGTQIQLSERETEKIDEPFSSDEVYSSRNQLRRVMHVSTQKMKETRKLLETISWIISKCYSFSSLSLSTSLELSFVDWYNEQFDRRIANRVCSIAYAINKLNCMHSRKKNRMRQKRNEL